LLCGGARSCFATSETECEWSQTADEFLELMLCQRDNLQPPTNGGSGESCGAAVQSSEWLQWADDDQQRPGANSNTQYYVPPTRDNTLSTMPDGLHAALTYLFSMENSAKTSVLYNATCPVCNLEIQHYTRYVGGDGLPIRFDDLNSDARETWGLDADTAARRLYVLHEGALTSGIPGFLVLWTQMPKYWWLGKVVGFPGIKQIACVTYDQVLAPAIYRWHLRRLRKQTTRVQD
jgi:predicted DCC family thiol-disulfide oxidoreductase YuxK